MTGMTAGGRNEKGAIRKRKRCVEPGNQDAKPRSWFTTLRLCADDHVALHSVDLGTTANQGSMRMNESDGRDAGWVGGKNKE